MIGYKVVCRNLTSSSAMGYAEVHYKIGKSVKPNLFCGPLTVFTNQEDAENFFRGLITPVRIFRCKFTLSKRKSVWGFEGCVSLYDLPKGTALARSVTFLEEIKL